MNPTNDKNKPATAKKPIRYMDQIESNFEIWAAECGFEAEVLRRETERAIRTRHGESTREDSGSPIFTLSIGDFNVHYSFWSDSFLVRGYSWEIDHEPIECLDGGGIFI